MSQPESWLLRNVEIDGVLWDCTIRDGVISALVPATHDDTDGPAPNRIGNPAPAAAGARVLDAGGGALLPGLADHHVHLFAAGAALPICSMPHLSSTQPASACSRRVWTSICGQCRPMDLVLAKS